MVREAQNIDIDSQATLDVFADHQWSAEQTLRITAVSDTKVLLVGSLLSIFVKTDCFKRLTNSDGNIQRDNLRDQNMSKDKLGAEKIIRFNVNC